MAGTKETPRQRMIGMMYLVLTALLALNVSKEIINAFVKLDQKLLDNQINILSNTSTKLIQLENSMHLPGQKEKVRPFYEMAISVRKHSREAEAFIASCKNELIREVEGMDWIQKTEEGGRVVFRSLMDIQTKDDYDAATRLFGGEKGSTGYVKGEQIRQKMHAFRDRICAQLGIRYERGKKYFFDPKNIDAPEFSDPSHPTYKTYMKRLDMALKNAHPNEQPLIRNIFQTLTLPSKIQDHEEAVDWQLGMFDHAPVVAAAALFTSLQNDILTAESLAMDLISQRVSLPPYKFNKIEPMAFASSAFYNMGDSIEIKVMTAAYDSTEVAKVKWSNTTEDIDAKSESENVIRLRASAPGEHTVFGKIAVREGGNISWKPWAFKYEVSQPTGYVSPLDMNVLYFGRKNRVSAVASGFPNERVKLNAPGCTVVNNGNGEYEVSVSASQVGREVDLSVSGTDLQGKTQSLGISRFKVRPLPMPLIFFGSTPNTQSTIRMNEILGAENVSAGYDASITLTGVRFEVRTCELKVISRSGGVVSRVVAGGRLTAAEKAMLRQLRPGDQIAISNIKVYVSGTQVRTPNVLFEVR